MFLHLVGNQTITPPIFFAVKEPFLLFGFHCFFV